MGLVRNAWFVSRRTIIATALAVALLGSNIASSRVQAAEKVAVISIKPFNQLFADVEYLMNATGTTAFGQFFMPQIKAFTQGIDGDKPVGVVLMVDGTEFKPLGFVPVTDLDTVLKNFEQQLGRAADAGDGIMELQGPQPVFVKEQGGWAFIGQSVQALKELPGNPVKLLEGMPKRYDIGITAFVKNVPDPYKQMMLAQLQQGVEQAAGDDPQAAAAQVEQLKQMFDELDQMTVGWQVDSKQREMHLETVVKALDGTEMSKQLESMRDPKTEFGGFLVKDAAIRGNITSLMSSEQIEQSLAGLARVQASTMKEIDDDEDLDDGTRSATKQLVQTFFRIAESTLKTGKLDSCTSVVLKPKAMTIVSAGHVADGGEVETAVKQLVAAAKNQPDLTFSRVKFNAAQHAGINFHSLALPIPEDEYIRKVLGDTLEVTIGTADDSAYIAIGTDGMDHLKRQIDGSKSTGEQTVDPFFGEVALTPILKFAESVEPSPILRSLAAMLEDQPDRVHIRASLTDDGDSAAYRLTLQEGVLGVIGEGVKMVGIGGGGGF